MSMSTSLTSWEGIFLCLIVTFLIWIIIIMLTLRGIILEIIVSIPLCMGRHRVNWTRSPKVNKGP